MEETNKLRANAVTAIKNIVENKEFSDDVKIEAIYRAIMKMNYNIQNNFDKILGDR